MSSTSGKPRSVEFLSDGLKLRGNLRLPNGHGPFPLVILGQGLGALKEWSIPEVVDALVEVGIAGLSFDYRNVGDSEGQPRDEVAHLGRLEDWQNAISYATSLEEIDVSNIGIWGTSLGGRDVLVVAAIDKRIKAVVSQTPLIKWFPGLCTRMGGFGTDVERYYKEVAEDRTNRALGHEPRYVPFVKQINDDRKKAYIEAMSKEELRNYSGRLTLQSYALNVLNDVTPFMEMIAPTPLRVILAEKDFLPGQREAYNAAKEPKSLVEVEGDHFSPYTESKGPSILAAKEWFVEHFKSK